MRCIDDEEADKLVEYATILPCCWTREKGPVTSRLLERKLITEEFSPCIELDHHEIGSIHVSLTRLGHIALGLYRMMKTYNA